MTTLSQALKEYQKQIQKGIIPRAYKGLMNYILSLKNNLKGKYPDYFVSGGIYYGYMDMTYFSFTPQAIKDQRLKVAIVFMHNTFKFEAWLAGNNKRIQQKYWELIRNTGWNKYHIVETTEGVDSIVEYCLVNNPNFDDLEHLTMKIEEEIITFIHDVELFLSEYHTSLL